MDQNQQPDFNEQKHNSEQPTKKRSTNLFSKREKILDPKEKALRNYTVARQNLLLVIFFTVANVFLVAFNADFYMLFSASVPLLVASVGGAALLEGAPEATITMAVCLIVALVLIAPYLLCYIFSKKHYGWMVGALVYFSIDSAFLLLTLDLGVILDILFHIWVMYYLIIGVKYGKQTFAFQKQEAEQPVAEQDSNAYFFENNNL